MVNASASISGRYPNVGPLLLAAAGIPLVDGVGPEVMTAVTEGDVLRSTATTCAWATRSSPRAPGTAGVARGADRGGQQRSAPSSSASPRTPSSTCARSATCSPTRPTCPTCASTSPGRHVLVVVRGGSDYQDDLAALRAYIREMQPGADRRRRRRRRAARGGPAPDVIIGDFDSVSDDALQRGAELVVHAYPGGGARRRAGSTSWACPT